MGPTSNDWYFYKRRGHTERECNLKQAETGVTQLYTKECQGLPEATRNQEVKERSSLGPSGGAWRCLHLDFRHLASISEREQISIVLNHPVCGILPWQAWETKLILRLD